MRRQCEITGCEDIVQAYGLCQRHDYMKKKWGDPLAPTKEERARRKRNIQGGYVVLYRPEHANAKYGRLFEHTLVMSEILGRPLHEGEEVHHKNGMKDDNRPENLELWTRSHPHGTRVADLLEWAISFLDRYKDLV